MWVRGGGIAEVVTTVTIADATHAAAAGRLLIAHGAKVGGCPSLG